MPGEVPQGWAWKRLGEHFTRINRRNVAGVRRVLTASGDRGLIDQEEFFNKRVAGADLSTYLHIKNGEFAYNRSAMAGYPVGAVKRLDRYNEGVVSSLYLCFGLSETATVDLDFAAQVLDSRILEDELRPIAKVGARAHGLLNVSADDFMSVLFPTPPLPEQKKIAAILSSVDEAIQTTQAVIDQSRRVKEGLLQDLLTRGLPGHTRFKETEIGEVPESWDVTTVGDLIEQHGGEIKTGPFGTMLSADEYTVDGVPLVAVKEIRKGYIEIHADTPRVPIEVQTRLPQYMLRVGDVVFARKGGVERCAVVEGAEGKMLGSDAIRLRLPNRVSPAFVGYYLQSSRHTQWMVKEASGSIMAGLNQRVIARIPLGIPPLDEQERVSERLREVDDTLHHANSTLQANTLAKRGLLQDLLTGKVRVSP